jgi:HEAT repeat protein
VGKQAFDKKLEAIAALTDAADLRKPLKDRNNFLASKAAVRVARLGLKELIPDLVSAFDQFMADDPKCWAKAAIAKALKDLEHDDAAVFVRGLKHVQMEASYGAPEDSAITLRATCALALVQCSLPRYETLRHLVDALADSAKSVRIDAARAIAQIPGQDSLLLLRLKAQTKDEPDVIGQCFVSLLAIDASEQLSFVAQFLDDRELVAEAAAAIGECHDPRAAAILIENHHKSPAILLALGASREKSAAEFLMSIVRNGRKDQAIHAARALETGRFRDEYLEQARAAMAERGFVK